MFKSDNGKWHEDFVKSALADPHVKAEYEAFKLQFELAEQLKNARKERHMTQENVAEKMCTKKAAIARIESSGGKGKHSPSLTTLVKYAKAIGCHLEIKVIPDSLA
ncbi:MAG: hypothetical protein LEGION0398_MBIBDBAK_00164 [Legionellaceae bacterium]